MAFDEEGELEQVNVLYSFLEDRYMKTVCVFFFMGLEFWEGGGGGGGGGGGYIGG